MGCFSSPDLRGPCPSVERGDLCLRSKGVTNPLRAAGFYSAPTVCGTIAGDPELSAEKAGRGCAAQAGGRVPGAVGQVSSLSFGVFNARKQG